MKALTTKEINRLLSTIQKPRLRAMVLLAFRHGMRASEVCDLRWSDIDRQALTITVRRLKNSLTTVQPLSAEEVAAIDALDPIPGCRYLFPARDGSRMHRGTFWSLFRDAAKAAGLSVAKRHPHALKHSLGYALVKANVNLAVVKRALGHRSINSTAIYAVPTDEEVGAIVSDALAGVQ